MAKYDLGYDAEILTQEYLHSDPSGKLVIETIQDAEPIVEYNARMAEHLDKKQDWWFIGSIPMQLCTQWAQECGAKPFTKQWQAYAKKQIQLPEYRKLNVNRIRL